MDVMVDNDGISGNVVYSMTDKQYRHHVEEMFYYKDSRTRMAILASDNSHGSNFRYRVWLQVMGLIETWDVIK